MDSSSASPLIRVAPILLKQRGAIVALGAVGLSLGAAWAWNHRRKPDASDSDLASDIAPKAASAPVSPQKRHRSKRHKSKTKASAECEQPLTECAAKPVPPPNASSPPASQPVAAPAQAPAEQEQAQQVHETSQEATPEPEKAVGAESDGEPTASSTGCTQELDVEMTDVATFHATQPPAREPEPEPTAGEWRTVERKQRGRRSVPPPADCLDEPEPQAARAAEATTAAEAATAAAESAVEPPAAEEEAARALAEPPAAAPIEGGSELAPKKAKKKKKRPAPPASLRASEEDEPSPAVAEPAPSSTSNPSPNPARWP